MGPGEKARIRVRQGGLPEVGDLIAIDFGFTVGEDVVGLVIGEAEWDSDSKTTLKFRVYNLNKEISEDYYCTPNVYKSILIQGERKNVP